MLNILVVGGYDDTDKDVDNIRAFCQELGRQVIDQGHCLLGACQTTCDKDIAESAWTRLKDKDPSNADRRLISYILSGATPTHQFGSMRQSRLVSWDPGAGPMFIPEPIKSADVVILVRGFDGTFRAAHWSSVAKKPLLPLTCFGGAAARIYQDEYDQFDQKYSGRIAKTKYEELTTVTTAWASLAATVVSLAEDAATSNQVVVLMSYPQTGPTVVPLRNLYASYQQVGKEFDYTCERVEDQNTIGQIVPRILARIRESAFVIADLTELRPNVLFEVGYALALDKPIVFTAQKGTDLPFDVKDLPTIFWDPIDMLDLQEKLRTKIKLIAETQGRR